MRGSVVEGEGVKDLQSTSAGLPRPCSSPCRSQSRQVPARRGLPGGFFFA